MVTMSNNVDLDARVEGSAGAALLRCCCAGESLFMSHFTLKPGEVHSSPYAACESTFTLSIASRGYSRDSVACAWPPASPASW